MPPDPFRAALRGRSEITITTIGRRTGRARTLPVWFVLSEGRLWLLPMAGTRNHWFRNLLADLTLRVRADRYRRIFRARPRRSRSGARHLAALFSRKYGRADVEAYYSRLDAAVEVPLRTRRASSRSTNSPGAGR